MYEMFLCMCCIIFWLGCLKHNLGRYSFHILLLKSTTIHFRNKMTTLPLSHCDRCDQIWRKIGSLTKIQKIIFEGLFIIWQNFDPTSLIIMLLCKFSLL